jgi:hypothetical protein
MGEMKSIVLSKTVWGVVISIVATAAGAAGYDIGGDTEGLANDVVALIGLGLALYGRVKAVKRLTV